MCGYRAWPILFALIRGCFPEFSRSKVEYYVRAYARQSCIAWLDDRPVGYWMHSGGQGPKTAWLEQYGVARTYRSMGIGRLLTLDYLRFTSWAGFEQVGAVVKKSNISSLGVFVSLGFDSEPGTRDDLIRVSREIAPQEFGDWPAAETLAGVDSSLTGARQRFLVQSERPFLEKVVGRATTALIALADRSVIGS